MGEEEQGSVEGATESLLEVAERRSPLESLTRYHPGKGCNVVIVSKQNQAANEIDLSLSVSTEPQMVAMQPAQA
ncbi:hypothetical protein L914_16986, partial [Phytophthora nicotianae]